MTIRPKLYALKNLLLAAAFLLVCYSSGATYILKPGDVINFDVVGSGAAGIGGTTGTYLNYDGQGGLVDTGKNYWNPVVRNGTTPFGNLSDGTNVSPISLSFTTQGGYAGHAQGALGTPAGLEIFYCYAGNGSVYNNTLNNIPAGTYNLYLYGKDGGYNDRGTTFTVWSDLTSATSASTINTAANAGFTQGDDYVVIPNVSVGIGGQIFFSYKANSSVIYAGNANTEGNFNGLQLQTVAITAVPKAPVLLTQPQSQIVRQGLSSTFSTTVDSGGLINSFQWYYNGVALTNSTGATLVLPNVVASEAGSYRVIVTNAMGSITSSVATLTVDTTTTTSLFTGGDAGEGLDFSGNIVQAQYFGVDQGLLTIQNANFAYGTLGSNPDGLNAPNFGAALNDQNLSALSTYVEEGDYSFGNPNLSFTIPGTTAGKTYKLQLLFHDYLAGSSRNLGITIGSEVLDPALNPSAKGAYDTNNLGVVISYFFTATSSPLQVQISGDLTTGSAFLNAFALEELPTVPSKAPYFVLLPASQTNVPTFTPVSFSPMLSGDPKSVHYQWSYAGTSISGATNSTLLVIAQTTNTGAYTLVANNSAGSVSASATLTVNSNMACITGPAEGQGLDLQGNIFLAECYGPTANLPINGVTFVPSGRSGGTAYGQNTPNFGTNTDQVNLATLSAVSVWGSLFDFTIPTSTGIKYKLQLVFHDNGFLTAGNRIFTVTAGGVVLATNLDLAAMGANVTNPKDIALINYFTGDGNPLEIKMTGAKDNPTLSALTVENLSSAEPPPVQSTALRAQAVSVGDTVTLGATFSGQDLSYQWQKLVNGTFVNLANGANVSGATTNRLTLSNAALADAGTYQLKVWNFAGDVHPAVNLLVYPNLKRMVGHWISGGQSLSDTSGFTPAQTHDGTAVGAGSLTWSANVPLNFTGSSLDLTAGNLLISINNSATNDPGYLPTFDAAVANNLSISFWAKGWVPGWGPAYISKNGEAEQGYQIRDMNKYINADSNFDGVTFTVRGTSIDDPLPSIEGDASAWHHYAATYDGVAGIRSLYIDNQVALKLSNDFGPMITADGSHLVLGGKDQNGYGGYFSGLLYDVRVYGYALSATEIQAINKIAPSLPIGLTATMASGHLTVSWTNGVLQSTTALNGPSTVWVTEATASPVVINLTGTTGNKFYRTVVSQ